MTFSTIAVLAAQQPQGPEFGKASPIGLLVIVVLLIGTALLIRSMNKQLRKLPKSFDANHPEADQAFDEGTDAAGAGVADVAPDGDGVSVTVDTSATATDTVDPAVRREPGDT
ncbi:MULTISPECIES: hypothetical protein [Gordonia]|uniref:hypothetical protein n=1 Tax=Gordonia sp. 852002-10350_SCH5691597 TaxID=1834085 RepID=UPI0007EB0F54|nr:hypothetical protein [Gordonia sp. 852002-10350_SCH5691597]OBA68042.1 hypothetical protein A5777_16130 [Gordonia sp. 852002-10350_SCH5691597]